MTGISIGTEDGVAFSGSAVSGQGEESRRFLVAPPGLEASLARGGTLPGSWYTDPAVFALEQERIFGSMWQYAGLASEIPDAGDFYTWRVGRIPTVVVRDEDGRVRVFANVCPHRGSVIVQEECGHRMSLQCPYHSWTFGLDGKLRKVPRAERNALFDGSDIGLAELRTYLVGSLVFVNPDREAPAFTERFGDWLRLLEERQTDFETPLELYETRKVDLPVNWKVVCENNFECYHCPANHPGLAAIQDVTKDNLYELYDWFSCDSLHPKQDLEPAADGKLRLMELTEETRDREKLNFLFPNFWCRFFTLNPGLGAIMIELQPVGVAKTCYVRQYFFSADVDDAVRRDSVAFVEAVFAEDESLCINVQTGLESGVYQQGSLVLPATEPAIQNFQRMVYRSLTGA